MTALRNVNPIISTAAILPKHRLTFNVPGTPLLEPSWAAVEPTSEQEFVHGVLYKLSEEDFSTICNTEGVPIAYRLHRCRVLPYRGNDDNAGHLALQNTLKNKTMNTMGVAAFTLRAGREEWRSNSSIIKPSRSYLNVLIRGAKEFKLDQDYVTMLESLPVGVTIGNGIAEVMLQLAERKRQQ